MIKTWFKEYRGHTFSVIIRERTSFKSRHGGRVTDTSRRDIATNRLQFVDDLAGNGSGTDHFPSHTVTDHEDDILATLVATERSGDLVNHAFAEQQALGTVRTAIGKGGKGTAYFFLRFAVSLLGVGL